MSCTHQGSIPNKLPVGAKVYKDDCMYSFDNAENNVNGLDVCLICFQAYSRNEINYTQLHTADASHSVYLNIVKTAKPIKEEERQAKMQKLEIRDVKEDELFDIKYLIYCSIDDVSIPLHEADANIKQLAEEVIAANSSNRDAEIKAWEQEIIPCEHSIEVEQFDNDNVDLSKCSQCELKENLWICLHCGALGCGRLQYGSTIPGNSHALAHFEQTDHPVAVKLGSLSATDIDNCDCYCYKCNDEVKVGNLSKTLAKFGIDLSKTTKTEKNLTEINLDQNMNWQFQLDGKDGEKLQPIFGPSFTGLSNLGNSCYLNSVVQALFDLSPYQDYFKNQKFPDFKTIADPSKDLASQLLKLYDGLVSGRYSKPGNSKGDDYQVGIKPTMFKALIGEDHEEFKTNRQQDAFEFLTYLLEKIDKQMGLQVNEQFKFLMTNKVLCSNCMKGTASDELLDSIAVNVEDEVLSTDSDGNKIYKPVELIDSIKNYCEDEIIEGFKCEKCEETTEAIKSSGFKAYPEILIVNAKRIKLENWVPVKVDVPIKVPEHLDLAHFEASVGEEFEYVKPGDEEASFTANQEALNNLLQMGFPEPRCIKALYKTGNSSLDDAMNWLFAHMEDPDIDDPLVIEAAPKTNEVSEDLIATVASMGFSNQLAKKALILNNNDPNAAVEWLFSNPDDDGVITETPAPVNVAEQEKELIDKLESQSTTNHRYKLKSVICHKGASPHTGHYVVFIKKLVENKEKWVLFNDEKVVECDELNTADMEKNGYIYIFERE